MLSARNTWTTLSEWCLMLMMVGMFFRGMYLQYAFLAYVFFSVGRWWSAGRPKVPLVRWHLAASLLLVLWAWISVLYSDNRQEGVEDALRWTPLLILPLIGALGVGDRRQLARAFIGGAVLASLVCLGFATHHLVTTGTVYTVPGADHLVYNYFMHQLLTRPIHMHPVYFACFVTLASALVLFELFKSPIQWRARRPYLLILLWVFFAVMISLFRSAIFAVIFPVINALVVLYMRRHLLRNKRFGLVALALGVVMVLFSYEIVKSKVEVFTLDFEMSDDHMTPLTMRLAKWTCAWDVIGDHPVLGVGIGDAQDVLDATYERVGFHIGLNKHFNAHNVYLQAWLSGGVVMFFLLLWLLVGMLAWAVRQRDLLFFCAVLSMAAFGLTESTLDVQKGVFYLALCGAIFVQSKAQTSRA